MHANISYQPTFRANSRFLITGGTGFIGTWLVDALLKLNDRFDLGCEFTLLTRNPDAARVANPRLRDRSCLSLLAGDVANVQLPDEHFDYLIHGAAVSAVWDEPENYLDTILTGTKNIMQWARRNKINKILFLSSGAVYGETPLGSDRLTETMMNAPRLDSVSSVYGEAKRCAELMVHLFGGQYADVTVARLFSFFGPLMPRESHFAFSQFLMKAVSHENIVIQNPEACRSYLYIEDTAQCLIKLLKMNNQHNVYNIGGASPLTMEQLARNIVGLTQSRSEILIQEQKNRPTERSVYVPDVSRFHAEFEIKNETPFAQGLRLTRPWFSSLQDKVDEQIAR